MEERWEVKRKEGDDLGKEKGNNEESETEGERMKGKKRDEV